MRARMITRAGVVSMRARVYSKIYTLCKYAREGKWELTSEDSVNWVRPRNRQKTGYLPV